jgi:putative salt-induced outer membrane protein YdiY
MIAIQRHAVAAALAGLTLLGAARAQDTVTLQNGDRLSGKIQSVTAGGVVIDTPAAGTVTVRVDQLAGISAAAPIKLATSSGDKFEGTITGIQNGQLQVSGSSGARSIAASELVEWQPAVTWVGSVTAGAALTTGNTDRVAANAAAEVIRRSEDTRLTVRGTWDYGEDKATGAWVLSQRRVFGSAKYDWFFSKRTYLWGQTTGEYDKFADLDLRLTAGGGVGYQFYDDADFALQGELGLTYFDENRIVGTDDSYLAARGAYRARWNLNDQVTLLQDGEFYPSVEDVADFYARIDTRLRASLTSAMFAQLQWIFDYDNTPATGFERQDHRVLASVGWSF